MTEPTSTNANIEQLEKDPPLRIPDTYVHGIVTKNGSVVQGAKVELWKNGNLLDYVFTSEDGSYNICVCCQHAGTGTYLVKAQKFYKNEGLLTAEKSFYWDWQNGGPWDFEIDLQLGIISIEKYF